MWKNLNCNKFEIELMYIQIWLLKLNDVLVTQNFNSLLNFLVENKEEFPVILFNIMIYIVESKIINLPQEGHINKSNRSAVFLSKICSH